MCSNGVSVFRRHGEHHPEVVEVERHFASVAADLIQHMFKEERVLFPYIDMPAEAARPGGAAPAAPFGTIANPIRMMEAEHEGAGNLMAEIRRLTADFAPPPDACTTYRVT